MHEGTAWREFSSLSLSLTKKQILACLKVLFFGIKYNTKNACRQLMTDSVGANKEATTLRLELNISIIHSSNNPQALAAAV